MFFHCDLDLCSKAWREVAKTEGHGVWLSGIDLSASSKEAFASYLEEIEVPACALYWQYDTLFTLGPHPEHTGKCVLFFTHSTLADLATKLLQGTAFMGKSLTIHHKRSPANKQTALEEPCVAPETPTDNSGGADATASAISTSQQVTVPDHTGTAPVDPPAPASSSSVGSAVVATRSSNYWDKRYTQVVPMPKDGQYSFGPGGPGGSRIVPVGEIPEGYVEYKHPPRPYRKNEAGVEYDPRWSMRAQDNSFDEPWKSTPGFFYPTYTKLKEAGLIRDDWEPGQFVRPSDQEKGVCISNSPDYVPPGEMGGDFRSLTFYGHMPNHVRPPGVTVGWGGWDEWREWQLHGRHVKPEMLKPSPKPDPCTTPLVLKSENGEQTVVEPYHSDNPEAMRAFHALRCPRDTQSIYERVVEKSNLGKGMRSKYAKR
ncbi:hypothetical protein PG984_011332 [Apiospora sp. TS-2023a]